MLPRISEKSQTLFSTWCHKVTKICRVVTGWVMDEIISSKIWARMDALSWRLLNCWVLCRVRAGYPRWSQVWHVTPRALEPRCCRHWLRNSFSVGAPVLCTPGNSNSAPSLYLLDVGTTLPPNYGDKKIYVPPECPSVPSGQVWEPLVYRKIHCLWKVGNKYLLTELMKEWNVKLNLDFYACYLIFKNLKKMFSFHLNLSREIETWLNKEGFIKI